MLGASENNLRDVDVEVPLGVLVAVTGVSGAGKSTLVNDVLYPALARRFHNASGRPGRHRALAGIEQLDKVIAIDQRPIGRTPRSNPVTYIKVFDAIRDFFAQLPDARVHGYKPGRFSFNVKGGRCEACQGDGVRQIEMHFLPDVYVKCEECQGRRFNESTLARPLQGEVDRGRARPHDPRGARALLRASRDPRAAAAPGGRRARLHPPRAAVADVVGRRGAAHQAGPRAGAARHGPDALHPRRADDRVCTSTTCASCSTCSSASSTPATPCS